MKPIITMDFETDPFAHKVSIHPFACGLYDGKDFDSVWSPECVPKMVERLKRKEPSIIYMHNGGRFDIFLRSPTGKNLFDSFHGEMTIINGRVVKAQLGEHEFRDSYALLPFALGQYKKDDIDIDKLRAECRESHKVEILSYLRGDCVYLHELVTGFISEFGDFLTIGSASMNQLRKFHPFETVGRYFDEKFRSQFFFGGRVQCFQSGIINQEYKIYDVNSMYPSVMRDFKHPAGAKFEVDRKIGPKTAFIISEGYSNGAFPIRSRKGITFEKTKGVFASTIHEWNAAEATGYYRPIRVLKTYQFDEWISFGEFVDHFFEARKKASRDGDELRKLFYKYILNSAYGKFAQNPDNFFDHKITHGEQLPSPWEEQAIFNEGEYVIWKKAIKRLSYYNVAIGASITGAARAVLMRALAKSAGLVYCDTDSIIASSITGVGFDENKIGAWKEEGSGNRIAMAGKKLYACFDGEVCIKKATKGARISPEEIVNVAQGETVTFRKQAPTFKLDGRVDWIERRIKRTV